MNVQPRLEGGARSRRCGTGVSRAREAAAVPSVMVQQDCIPHYRIPVFKRLGECPELAVKFVSDPALAIPYMRIENGADHGLHYLKAKTYLVPLFRRFKITWQPAAVRAFVKDRPSVLIAQGAFNNVTVWLLCGLCRFYGIPVLLWGHGLLKDERGLRWWLRKALYRLAAGHLLYGGYARGLLAAKGFDPATLHVIYNSLDYDLQTAVMKDIDSRATAAFREELGIGPGEGMLVFTGRLQPEKRLDMLVGAVAMLARQGRRVHAVLVGEGSARFPLTDLARRLGVTGQVHLLGATYDERRLGRIIGAADLAVFPANAGLSIIHAMTFGTPVLIHDRVEYHGPEWEAVEEGMTGFFYRFDDGDDLASKISAAVFPRPRKAEMSAACRAAIEERYNPHRQVETIVAAVRAVVAPNRVPKR